MTLDISSGILFILEATYLPCKTLLLGNFNFASSKSLSKPAFLRIPSKSFGWRHVDFFVSTQNGKTNEVVRHLLTMDAIIFVGKSIGHHTIDLRVESIVKDNSQILDLMENMKAMGGIKHVVWSEIVRTVPRKQPIPNSVIEQL
jgi:hypothetical protein